MDRRTRVAELLLNSKMLTREQLDEAIGIQAKTGGSLFAVLISMGYISEETLIDVMSKETKIPIVDLGTYNYSVVVSAQLPEIYARQYEAVLLKMNDHALVGMVDPLNIIAVDEISRILKKPVETVLIRKKGLDKILGQIYRRSNVISNYALELENAIENRLESFDTDLPAQIVDTPVRKFVLALFEDAVQINASDIHIEPGKNALGIRLRVDGVLHEQVLQQKKIAPAISQRLKLMAKLNMAEKRLPLDGRFSFEVSNKIIDVRLSTMPTEYGESIVMRLFEHSEKRINLDECGMSPDMLEQFRKLIHYPRGMILVTGPTGSGKTTTLYGAIEEINTPEVKIITIEDPVEYKMSRVSQVQIKPQIGLDFAAVLRSSLRQDPDIILIGEMRDQETASIAMRAALTGHLVLSTLHTNDTVSTAIRLLDMGVQGYLIAATLQCIIAQRLIRKICHYCKEPYTPTAAEKEWIINTRGEEAFNNSFFIGKGCTYCNKIGYLGRLGVFEFLVFSEEMISALARSDQAKFMALGKTTLKGRTLSDQAMHYANTGLTTIYEVMRVSEIH